jgi:long-chain acyl-CoA synthetase
VEGVETALHFDESDVFLSLLPLHHTYEATCGFITPIVSGATIVYARSLKSKEILEDIAFNKVGILCGVPLLFEKMNHAILRGVQQASVIRKILFHILYWLSSFGWVLGYKWGRLLLASIRQKAGLSTIRMIVSGGAPLPSSTARFFNYLGIDFLQGYGLTECSPVISTNRPDNIKFGSVGPPLCNIEVRIHEPDINGIGEIAVRGKAVTPGYLDNKTATAEVIRDGWLFTGDMGYLKGGHLWITGRRKNVIVTAAGKNIYPEELEEKLGESPFILETVVFGKRKESKQGEEVSALIVPDIEQFKVEFGILSDSPDPDKIKEVIAGIVEDVNDRIAEYKRISSFEVRLQELEKTSTKKVKRFMYNQRDVQ